DGCAAVAWALIQRYEATPQAAAVRPWAPRAHAPDAGPLLPHAGRDGCRPAPGRANGPARGRIAPVGGAAPADVSDPGALHRPGRAQLGRDLPGLSDRAGDLLPASGDGLHPPAPAPLQLL